jgi:transposase
MAKRKFELTDKEVQELKVAYASCKDGPTQTRYLAVRLYGTGYPVTEVIEITGCSQRSLMDWCRIYRQRGIAGLVDKRAGGNAAKLNGEQIGRIETIVHCYTPAAYLGAEDSQGNGQFWTVPDVAKLVNDLYAITYKSSTSYRSLMKACGLSLKKPATQYKSRSETKVMAFEEWLEKKLIDTAQERPATVILAEDEASLYLQATLKVVWYPRGQTPLLLLDPSRQCTHFYGALNLSTGDEMAMRSSTMNAEVTVEFLQTLLDAHPGRDLLLFWDRAPWHRGQPIRDILDAHPRLEIVEFPAGAPDLNPQEHVWKDARNAVSHNHCLTKLEDLVNDFEDHLTSNTFPCSLLDKHAYPQLCARFI